MFDAIFWSVLGAGAFWYFTRPKEKDMSKRAAMRAAARRVANLGREQCTNCGHHLDHHSQDMFGCSVQVSQIGRSEKDLHCECGRFQ